MKKLLSQLEISSCDMKDNVKLVQMSDDVLQGKRTQPEFTFALDELIFLER